MALPQTKIAWEQYVGDLRSLENLDYDSSREDIAILLSKKIEEVVLEQAKRALKKGKIGVLFSGGVDSTLISYIFYKNKIPFTTITVGFQDDDLKLPEDLEESRNVLKKLPFEDHHEKILNYEEMELVFEETINLLGKDLANAVNVGVGSVEVAGIKELLKIDGEITQIFGGLGSEEIFAGYLRHKQAEEKHAECWSGLVAMYDRDLLRDFAIAKKFKIDFWVPFLSEELISFSMNIPVEYKLEGDDAKVILREAAVIIGLPKEFSFRPKRAAQYGSRTDKALSKIAHRKKYKYKKDYIQSFFKN